jgi:hypothetical protein
MWVVKIGLYHHELMETRVGWLFTSNKYTHLDFKQSWYQETLGM